MAFDLTSAVRDYGDVAGEASACRTGAALFDFSFVARARLHGPEALGAIAHLTRRPMHDLGSGRIRYAVRADAAGRLVSDLTIWRVGEATYEVMSGRPEDIADVIRQMPRGAAENLTSASAILSLQGPGSLQALTGLCDLERLASVGYYASTQTAIAGIDCLAGRLGYTGEAGFEIILPAGNKDEMWSVLVGRARPAGFAAADILRIEAGFVLFANEFRLPVSAAEVGLTAFAEPVAAGYRAGALELVCFSADAVLDAVPWQPPAGLTMPRQPGELAVTSACRSPIAGRTLGLGYVLRGPAGVALFDPCGRFTGVRREPRPFYDAQKLRPRAPWKSGCV